MTVIKKKEGFKDQKAIILPYSIIHILEKDPLTAPIHITDIGYYPKAQCHFRERRHGCKQNVLIYCIEGKGWLSLGVRNLMFPLIIISLYPPRYHIPTEQMKRIHGQFTGFISKEPYRPRYRRN
jgi:hypothetical protein